MIYKHEFLIRIKSILTWGITVAALAFVFFSFFSVFGMETEIMNEMLSKMPKEFLMAFGMENMTYNTILGYISFFFLFIQLCLSIQACNFGVGLVSIEETEMTADFLLTRPVSRTKIMTSKMLAALSSLLVTDLIFGTSLFVSISIFGEGKQYDMPTMVLLLLSLVLMQLFFFYVGLMISLFVKRVRNVTPYSLGLAFGMYVLSAFSGVFGDVKLEYITPFKHFEPAYIVEHASFNTPLLLINVTVTIISLVVAYMLYLRRDIHAVS